MIEVNGQYVTSDISDIITELKRQCELNGKHLFYKSTDTPNNYMICCPFHKNGQERKPSMGILKSDGTCHCFACGWVGSIQELVSNVFGYDDLGLYGSKWIIKNFLTLEVETRNDIDIDCNRNSIRSITSFNDRRNTVSGMEGLCGKGQFVTEEELYSYRWHHPYWSKRGITDENIIELFDLGYDKKTDCITFPVRDIHGNCLFIARRSVRTKYFNYPSGVEKPLYGIYELYKQQVECEEHRMPYNYFPFNNDIIVCESMIDALTCWQYGKYAVALNGLGNNLQFKQLRELPCRKLILATDNDEAGIKARQRISYNVNNKILTQYILPEGKKDINELEQNEFENLEEIFV